MEEDIYFVAEPGVVSPKVVEQLKPSSEIEQVAKVGVGSQEDDSEIVAGLNTNLWKLFGDHYEQVVVGHKHKLVAALKCQDIVFDDEDLKQSFISVWMATLLALAGKKVVWMTNSLYRCKIAERVCNKMFVEIALRSPIGYLATISPPKFTLPDDGTKKAECDYDVLIANCLWDPKPVVHDIHYCY